MTDAQTDFVATAATRRGLRAYLIGFALLGAAIGFFTGASESPVVGTLLPLLFGLAGGAGGFYLARVDFNKVESAFRLNLIGRAISVFLILCVIASLYGVALRTGQGFLTVAKRALLITAQPAISRSMVDLPDPRQALTLLTFRARLEALGATSEEQAVLIAHAHRRLSETLPAEDYARILRQLAQTTHDAAQSLSKTIREGPSPDRAGLLMMNLLAYAEDYTHWAAEIEGGQDASSAFIIRRLDGLQKQVDRFFNSPGDASWLAEHRETRQRVWDVDRQIIAARYRVLSVQSLNLAGQAEDTDRFLAAHKGAPRGADASDGSALPKVSFEN